MDRGAWRATVHGVAKESDATEQLHNSKCAYYSLSFRTGKPGMLQSTGLQRVRHDSATEQQSEVSFMEKRETSKQTQAGE